MPRDRKIAVGRRLKKLKADTPKREWRLRPLVLLSGNIPKPMHGVAPRVIKGQAWWNSTRRAAYASTNYHCIVCGVHKSAARYRQWLEGHEIYKTDFLLGHMVYLETVPVCHLCHNYIHQGRLQALLDKGRISQAKYTAVVQHGDELMQQHGLKRQTYHGPFAEWCDWRMVLDGGEYPPLYANEQEWAKAHAL